MRRPGFVGTAGAVAALLLGAGGCAGDPEPRFAPPSAEVSPSASESERSELSPQETVEAWVAARNAALASGEIAPVEEFATTACRPCMEYVDPIATIVGAGGRIQSAGWQVDNLNLAEDSQPDRPVVSGRLVRAAGTTTPEVGGEPFSYERQVDEAFFELTEGGAGWQIDFIYFSQG